MDGHASAPAQANRDDAQPSRRTCRPCGRARPVAVRQDDVRQAPYSTVIQWSVPIKPGDACRGTACTGDQLASAKPVMGRATACNASLWTSSPTWSASFSHTRSMRTYAAGPSTSHCSRPSRSDGVCFAPSSQRVLGSLIHDVLRILDQSCGCCRVARGVARPLHRRRSWPRL